jgi:nucleoside phosphorylase
VPEPIDILIISAHLPELTGLVPLLGEDLRATVGGHRIVAEPVGIGLSAAAGGTIARLSRLRPRAALFVGTCGAYEGSGLSLAEVVVAKKAHLASTANVEGRGEFPGPMAIAAETDEVLSVAASAGHARRVDVATTLAVTVDDALAQKIAKSLGCQVEHLEAFAVAQSCASLGVRLAMLLGVANRVGKGAREEWRKYHRQASAAATAVAASWVENGARGL